MEMKMAEQGRNPEVYVYFDMDGVLADFDRGVVELCHMEALSVNADTSNGQDDLMWDGIREVDHFYDRLELMPGAKEMFDRVWERYGDHCEILTGIPKEKRRILNASQDKKDWTHRLLSEKVKVNTVLRAEKKKYCRGPESVLIDDKEETIQEWREMGGTGILHVSAGKTIEEMEKLGLL